MELNRPIHAPLFLRDMSFPKSFTRYPAHSGLVSLLSEEVLRSTTALFYGRKFHDDLVISCRDNSWVSDEKFALWLR